jgi:hypothetical protein
VTQPAAEILLPMMGGLVVWQNGHRNCGTIGCGNGCPGAPGGLYGLFWYGSDTAVKMNVGEYLNKEIQNGKTGPRGAPRGRDAGF